MGFAGIVVYDTGERITNPVDEKLLAGFPLLWKDDLFAGRIFPLHIFGAEAAVAVTVRICGTVFLLPDVLEVHLPAGLKPGMDGFPVRFLFDLLWAKGFRVNHLVDFVLRHGERSTVSETAFPASGENFSNR